jgi:uncharacterized protein with ATP-grasp and redox domains
VKIFLDCIPCLIRQSLDAAGLATPDETVHARVLREVLEIAKETDLHESPPVMAQRFHRRIRELTEESDPYREVKDSFNRLALKQYPKFRNQVQRSANPMETAVRLAIAGNVIDFGANSGLTKRELHDAILHAMSAPLEGNVEGFLDAVSRANNILYLGDNAGEIVFDGLLIEQISPDKVTFAVRGAPVSNDATMVDAKDSGITEMVEVIDNGSDAPGTLLDDCSQDFRERFERADLVIAKGQGNYESLSEAEKDIWFLLKAKCLLIARDLRCRVGSLVLRRSESAAIPNARVGESVPISKNSITGIGNGDQRREAMKGGDDDATW